MSQTPKRPSRQSNPSLARLIKESGAAKKSLAFRLNQLTDGAGLTTNYTHTSWTNWTTRGIRPAAAVRPLIAQVLAERLGRPVSLREIDLDLDDNLDASIGLDFPRELATAVQVATRFWSQVDRRALLSGAGIAVASYNTPLRRWLTTPTDPTAASPTHTAFRRVGHTDITELLEAAEQARQWDSRYGGGNWRTSQLTICLKQRAAPLLHGTYTDAIGRQLFTATAQLSRLAGWTAFDNGDHTNAQRHYIQALRQARAAADIPLGGYILTCMALQCSLAGFHTDAIDMIDAAIQRTRSHTTPRVQAFFTLIQARIHARDGNPRAADTALATAETLLDTATTHTGDDPTWIDFFNHPRLAADAIEIQRDLTRPHHALRWNTHATMPTDTYARSHAIRQTVIASTHLQGHHPDLEHALHHAHRAITTLTAVNSARAVNYLNALLSQLTRWHTEPSVTELAHRAKTEILTA